MQYLHQFKSQRSISTFDCQYIDVVMPQILIDRKKPPVAPSWQTCTVYIGRQKHSQSRSSTLVCSHWKTYTVWEIDGKFGSRLPSIKWLLDIGLLGRRCKNSWLIAIYSTLSSWKVLIQSTPTSMASSTPVLVPGAFSFADDYARRLLKSYLPKYI